MNLSFVKYLPLIAAVSKSFFETKKHDFKVKNYDQTKEKIDTIEHLIVKLETKINECRHEIENLNKQILFSKSINLILSIIIILLIIFLR
ncbi:MAG: hypothetical protein PHY08_02865 [Candidatus Cloacimonetes bacterium]|jgi:wobble nucleotide-excising tRNase|nr:hypothetical protein [Candidatus Cloacimonadota bacterium]MDD4155493.1 hypothetical protein [Candidatus Cloacimonadota bacterium]